MLKYTLIDIDDRLCGQSCLKFEITSQSNWLTRWYIDFIIAIHSFTLNTTAIPPITGSKIHPLMYVSSYKHGLLRNNS
ncbi:hypothetical protein P7K49_014784 [Saguinus oedipus]|uniref:Uncharacterized protein n=1 Tax=Saguinus oedipus TaxID=9490 RepID=A0ABQ9V877_SAGOE|nr:hypothetical protein P7K49_014784 [Saguinus oedipus]